LPHSHANGECHPKFAKFSSESPKRRHDMHDHADGSEPVRSAPDTEDWKRERGSNRTTHHRDRLGIELLAAVVSVLDDQPLVLTAQTPAPERHLPTSRFEPQRHESLEAALRMTVLGECACALGSLEQLSADCRAQPGSRAGLKSLAIGYLALARLEKPTAAMRARWLNVYDLFPWEDWRQGRPECLSRAIVPPLLKWAEAKGSRGAQGPGSATARVRIAFGLDEGGWDDERVVERLDILNEAAVLARATPVLMPPQHCRTAAAALGRLRAKVRYRPVVFELLPAEFTLFEMQRTVEAILGPHLHKQNFRRLVEGMRLVEPTGDVRSHTGGRPAKLFRFRPEVLRERAAPGVRVRSSKAA
jgi:hypothetical protein